MLCKNFEVELQPPYSLRTLSVVSMRSPHRDYRESTQRVRRFWREYAWSTDRAQTVRMCC